MKLLRGELTAVERAFRFSVGVGVQTKSMLSRWILLTSRFPVCVVFEYVASRLVMLVINGWDVLYKGKEGNQVKSSC